MYAVAMLDAVLKRPRGAQQDVMPQVSRVLALFGPLYETLSSVAALYRLHVFIEAG